VQRGQVLGWARVREDGTFTLEMPDRNGSLDSVVGERGDGRESLTYKVFEGASVQGPVSAVWSTTTQPYTLSLTAQRTAPSPPEPKVIRGVVSRPDGFGVQGIDVTVHSLALTGESQEGATVQTNSSGQFEVAHSLAEASDLVIRAKAPSSGELLAASEITYDILDHARVYLLVDWDKDFAAADTPTTFEVVDGALGSEMDAAETGGNLENMTAESLAYVAEKNGLDAEAVGFYAAARILWNRAKPVAAGPLSAEVFFGFLCQGQPADLVILASLDLAAVTELLGKAIAEGDVRRGTDSNPSGIVDQLDKVVEAETVPAFTAGSPSTTGQTTVLSDVFAVTWSADSTAWTNVHLEDLLSLAKSHTGTTASLWTTWRDNHAAISDTELEKARIRLHVNKIVLWHVGVLQEVLNTVGVAWTDASDIASFSSAGLRTAVEAAVGVNPAPEDVPAGVQGTTGADRVTNYLSVIEEAIATEFPSRRIIELLRADSWSGTVWDDEQADAVTFFNIVTNRTLDLATEGVDDFMGTADTTGLSGQEVTALTQFLKAIQRLYRVTSGASRYAAIKALLSGDLNSAWQVNQHGRRKVVSLLEGSIGKAAARAVHATAQQQVAATLLTFTTLDGGFDGPDLPVLPNIHKANTDSVIDTTGISAALLSDGSIIEPDHAESVLSPSAYYVDLMVFLKGIDAAGSATAYNLLTQTDRRPDLKTVGLSKQNTYTTLPYIDLVNEVLEGAVVDASGGSPSPAPTETNGTSEERRAVPDRSDAAFHANTFTPAYAALETGTFPFSLPWSLSTAEARVFSEHLGLTRARLMQVMRVAADLVDGAGGLWSDAVAEEELGFHGNEWARLNDMASVSPPAAEERWGFPASTSGWLTTLSSAREFMERAQCEPAELYDLSNAVNATIQFSDGGDPLDIDSHTVTIGSADDALRAQSVLRLARRLNWSITDTDRTITALGGMPSTGGAFFATGFRRQLAQLKRLVTDSGLPVPEALTFWSDLDTHEGRFETLPANASLYTRTFLPDTLLDTDLRAAFTLQGAPLEIPEASPGQRYQLGNFDGTTHTHQPAVNTAVMGALGVTRAEYESLIATELTSLDLTLANVSKLFRATRAAKAAGVDLETWIRFRLLTKSASELDPFDPSNRHLAFEHLAAVQRWVNGPGLDLIEWALTHDLDAAVVLGTTDDALVDELRRVWERLLGDAGGDTAGFDPAPTGDWRPAALLAEFAAVSGLPELVASAVLDLLEVEVNDGVSGTQRDESLSRYFTATATTDTGDAYFLVDAATPGDPLVQINATTPPNALAYWTLARKAGAILAALDVDEATARELLEHGNQFLSLLDFEALPTLPAAASAGRVMEMDRLLRLLELRAAQEESGTSLGTLLAAAREAGVSGDDTAFRAMLAEFAGWTSLDVVVGRLHRVTTAPSTTPIGPADWNLLDVWTCVFEAMELATTLGVEVGGLIMVADTASSASSAAAARALAQSKHAPEGWWSTLTPMQDELREQQRNALVDFLVGDSNNSFSDVADLYNHYLLDPMMRADQLTTRLLMATGAAQVFVFRALQGLEPVSLSADAQARWVWMKRYRVWEAARKVFLWPENFAEPALRHTKTPQFEQLEEDLRSGELTDDLVREAYLTYLDGLEELSRIQVVATLQHSGSDDDGDYDRLHFFGQVAGDTGSWYWRTLEDKARFTPWRELDVGIEGRHLVPVVHHGRMMLIWATFEDAVEFVETGNTTADGEPETLQYPYLRMTVHHSELRDSGWTDPTTSSETADLKVSIGEEGVALRPHNVFLRSAFPSHPASSLEPGTLVLSAFTAEETERVTGAVGLSVRALNWMVMDGCTGEFRQADRDDVYAAKRREVPRGLPAGGLPNGQWWQNSGSVRLALEPSATVGEQVTVLSNGGLFYKLTLPSNEWTHSLDDTPIVFSDGQRSYLVRLPPDLRRGPVSPPELSPRDLFTMPASSDAFQKPVADVVMDSPFEPSISFKKATTTTTKTAIAPLSTSPSKFAVGDRRSRIRQSASIADIPKSRTYSVAPTGRALESGATSDLGAATVMAKNNAILKQLSPVGGALVPAAVLRSGGRIEFEPLFHPYVCLFISQVRRLGVKGLLAPDPDGTQQDLVRQAVSDSTAFDDRFSPTVVVSSPYPTEDISFDTDSAFGEYNWELFFHGPILVADTLRQDQKFSEAIDWFHFVFAPIGVNDDYSTGSVNSWNRARNTWRVKPLSDGIPALFARIRKLFATTLDEPDADMVRLANQIRAWRDSPFDPHGVASSRVLAYKKWVVMRYLDTLIEWGDHLFAQDTREAINEAAQLYILALQILGPRPFTGKANPTGAETALTFDDIDSGGGATTPLNSLEELELEVGEGPRTVTSATLDDALEGLESLLWFHVSPNTKILRYWDTIDDRLFKLRNGLSLAGVARSLPLFSPPIDPAVLVAAVSAGADLSTVLSASAAPLSHIRFSALLQLSKSLVGSVRAYGSALLQALEKKDAEELGQVRAGHEVRVLGLTSSIRELAVTEAQDSLAALERQRENAVQRKFYYAGLISAGRLDEEKKQLKKMRKSRKHTKKAIAAAKWNWSGSLSFSFHPRKPHATVGLSSSVAKSNKKALQAGRLQKRAARLSSIAGTQGMVAGWKRRRAEWEFQEASAQMELRQLDGQIAAARSRVASAERSLELHNEQIANSEEVADYLRSKFTSDDLYDWQASQLTSLYFQAYELAFGIAKRAEAAYQYELASTDTFLRFGYWNSARKGLLAGETLQHDLERMEVEYLLENEREMELSKNIALSKLDPEALVRLKETGECYFDIPEVLFDLDFPGHYLRRIRSVSLSIPAVTGKYEGVRATLELQTSKYRKDDTLLSGNYAEASSSETRFEYFGASDAEAIAISTAQDDAGVFQLDFNGPRYAPFERRGAVGLWRLTLTGASSTGVPAQFDWDSISDVVVQMQYTARRSTDTGFTAQIQTELASLLGALQTYEALTTPTAHTSYDGGRLGLSMARDFPDAWHAFLNPEAGATETTLSIPISAALFPREHFEDLQNITDVFFVLRFADGVTHPTTALKASAAVGATALTGTKDFDSTAPTSSVLGSAVRAANWQGLTVAKVSVEDTWTLTIAATDLAASNSASYVVPDGSDHRLDGDEIVDLEMILVYDFA